LIWSYPEMTETPPDRVPAVELEAPLCESENLGRRRLHPAPSQLALTVIAQDVGSSAHLAAKKREQERSQGATAAVCARPSRERDALSDVSRGDERNVVKGPARCLGTALLLELYLISKTRRKKIKAFLKAF
jgi:hypothetical protein